MSFRYIKTNITGHDVLNSLDNPRDSAHQQVFDHIKANDIAPTILSVAIDFAIEEALRMQRLMIAEALIGYDSTGKAAAAILKNKL